MGDWWPRGQDGRPRPACRHHRRTQSRRPLVRARRRRCRDRIGARCWPGSRRRGCCSAGSSTASGRYDPELLTEVELTFAPPADGGTRVTLEHRDLERFGADADAHRARSTTAGRHLLASFASCSTDTRRRQTWPSSSSTAIPAAPSAARSWRRSRKRARPVAGAVAPGILRRAPHLSRHPFARRAGARAWRLHSLRDPSDPALPRPHPAGAAADAREPEAAARMDQSISINDWYLFQGVGNVIGFQRIVGPR